MDINSIQSFGAVQSYAEQDATSPSSQFTSMLKEMLGSTSDSLPETMTSSENLRYAGPNQVFEPTMLASIIAASKSNTPITVNSPSIKNGNYSEIIKQAAVKYNLPEDLLSSVIQHESNFNKDSVSHAGAEGLMQLMPGTAKFLGVANSFDPVQNIEGGAKYLRQMFNQFNGSAELALAAYNAGPGNVKKYGGIPPFKETQNYVKKVLSTFNSKSDIG